MIIHDKLSDGAEVLRSMSISSSRIRMIRAYASKIKTPKAVSHTWKCPLRINQCLPRKFCSTISYHPRTNSRSNVTVLLFCPSKFASPVRTPASTTSITSTVYNQASLPRQTLYKQPMIVDRLTNISNQAVQFGIANTGLYRDVSTSTLLHDDPALVLSTHVTVLTFPPCEYESPMATGQ